MSDVLDDLCVCMHSRRYHDRNNERCHAGHCGCCKFVEFVEAQQAPEPTRSEPPRDYGDNRFLDWNLSQKVDVSPDVISSVAPPKPSEPPAVRSLEDEAREWLVAELERRGLPPVKGVMDIGPELLAKFARHAREKGLL